MTLRDAICAGCYRPIQVPDGAPERCQSCQEFRRLLHRLPVFFGISTDGHGRLRFTGAVSRPYPLVTFAGAVERHG